MDYRSVREARGLDIDAMANDAEKVLAERTGTTLHGHKPIARGYKFLWDEMALRFYVTQDFVLCTQTNV